MSAAAAANPHSAGAPRLDAWRIIGPGGGGAMYIPTISPHNSNDVALRCDMTGAYISHDGGESWRMYNLRGVVRFFVWDPLDKNTLYAESLGLFRSTDGGRTWKLVVPDAASVTGVNLQGDHAEDNLATRGGTRRVDALAVDPADSHVLYAAIAGGGSPTIEMSKDWGRTWERLVASETGIQAIWIDPKSPREDRTIYVASRTATAVRRGGVWKRTAAPAEMIDISAGFDPATGNLVAYAVSRQAIHVSRDGGASWQTAGLGVAAQFQAVGTSLGAPGTAYVSYSGLEGRYFGVAKTTDSGATWTPVSKEAEKLAANVDDAWIGRWFGAGWGENPLHLGVDPHNPDLCYSTDLGRTMRTTDGGKTWKGVYSKPAGAGGAYTSTGLDVTTNYGVHWDPFDHRRMFITYTDIGLFRSEDGGNSWLSATEGFPRAWRNTTYWMVFDPAVKGRAWAVASYVHDLPRPKMWRRTPFARYRGGVVVSDDGGRTWRVASASLPQTAATHILLDPDSPVSGRTLYVTGLGRGVFKSTDGGQTWALKNNGIEGAEPLAWRLSRDQKGTLYLVVARRSEDGSIGTPGDGALYRSTDGAEHWTKMALPAGVNGPNGLAIDPREANRLYLAAWGRKADPADIGGGVFLSTDGGANWKAVLEKDQHVYDVTVDPSHPEVLYACGFSSSAWRSSDRGLSWQRLKGYNFKWGHRVVLDPEDPGHVYVTTFGGSVWYGPALGDPKAIEDIVTPEVGY